MRGTGHSMIHSRIIQEVGLLVVPTRVSATLYHCTWDEWGGYHTFDSMKKVRRTWGTSGKNLRSPQATRSRSGRTEIAKPLLTDVQSVIISR